MPATKPYNRYQYETSPRKLDPIKDPKRNKTIPKKTTAKKVETTKNAKKTENHQKAKIVMGLIFGFGILFMIGYQNSQINEAFTQKQKLERQISAVQKENEQLEVSIQNSLNLSQIEQEAQERLGMQRLNSRQTTYVQLPKKDYVEVATEQIIIQEEEKSIIDTIIDTIIDWVKDIF